MELLEKLILVSEKAANLARLCRRNGHLFELLIEKKSEREANPRFVDDFKTLADVLIQEVVKHDVGGMFPDIADSIFGEETNIFSNKLGETITVSVEQTKEETASLLRKVLNDDAEAAELLAAEVHRDISLDCVNTKTLPLEDGGLELDFKNLGIWIDPIDSTAEYINGVDENSTSASAISLSGLKCVTVLIGTFDKTTGLPIMGVVNQPFLEFDGEKWSGRCFWSTPTTTSLPPPHPSTKTVCVSSSEDPTVITKLQQSGYTITEASGAGYKILTVITGHADAYILTKDSTFKWDTCGPQAILRSLGGDIVVYRKALEGAFVSVKYEEKSKNVNNRGGIVAYKDEEVLKDLVRCLT